MANPVCELLRCELPIQLAPMGSVAATPALPLAVAAAGGHGMYPALGLPPAAIAPVVDALADRTGAFGLNFIVPLMDRASLDLAVQRAPYIYFFLADPDPALVEIVHAGGAICGWQVESDREARAAAAAGCDVVIAKAWESGGRKRIEGATLLPLLDAVLDACRCRSSPREGSRPPAVWRRLSRPAPMACASAPDSSPQPSLTRILRGSER